MTEAFEKIGQLAAKADAAHSRLDRLETGVRDDLKEIKEELKELSAHMNRGKGWSAAFVFLAGISGAGLTQVLAMIFSHK